MCGVREIAAMKAFAIGRHLAYKDYADWYFLLSERHVTLPEIMRHAKAKFGGDFNDRLFLGQLVSMDDAPTQKIDFLRDEPDRPTIADFFREIVGKFSI